MKKLNQSGLLLTEIGTRRLVYNFFYNLIKWWDTICFNRYAIGKSVKKKKVNGNLNLKVSITDTDRSIACCLETQCNLRIDETTSRTKITTSNSYPQVQNIDNKTHKILY